MPSSEVAADLAGDLCVVPDPIEITRRFRRRIARDGVTADVVADLNVAISTGGGTATTRQDAPIRQGRSSRAASDVPDAKENT